MVPTYIRRLRKEVYLHNAGQTRSLCAGPAESWMHYMSHALNLPGCHLAIVWSGYCLAIMRSDLVRYSVVAFGYNLVSCTLSGLSHESRSGTGIQLMTCCCWFLFHSILPTMRPSMSIISPAFFSALDYFTELIEDETCLNDGCTSWMLSLVLLEIIST